MNARMIGIFIAAILVASVVSVLICNVGANVEVADTNSAGGIAPGVAGGIRPMVAGAGDILTSWDNGLSVGWGVGYDSDDGTVWISDVNSSDANVTNSNYEFYTDGTPTGRSYPTAAWASWWPFDMEYDRTRGYMYQVDSGGDNCIHAWDINTGNEMAVICDPNGVWNDTSQQCGVAYRETDDTLWIGGWVLDTIYHVKGLSWDNPGEVLDSYYNNTMSIAGLAWHCDGFLYVTGSSTQRVSVLTDDGAYTIIESYLLPGTGVYGAGADIDCGGNLWAATLYNNMTYLLDTDRPAYCCPTVAPVPTVTPFGIVALVSLLSAIAAVAIVRKRR